MVDHPVPRLRQGLALQGPHVFAAAEAADSVRLPVAEDFLAAAHGIETLVVELGVNLLQHLALFLLEPRAGEHPFLERRVEHDAAEQARQLGRNAFSVQGIAVRDAGGGDREYLHVPHLLHIGVELGAVKPRKVPVELRQVRIFSAGARQQKRKDCVGRRGLLFQRQQKMNGHAHRLKAAVPNASEIDAVADGALFNSRHPDSHLPRNSW